MHHPPHPWSNYLTSRSPLPPWLSSYLTTQSLPSIRLSCSLTTKSRLLHHPPQLHLHHPLHLLPPSEPKIKAVCTFVTVDLQERGPLGTKEETKEEYDTKQKDKRAKAKAKGRAHQMSPPPAKKVAFIAPAPSTSLASSRASSTSSTGRNPLVAHLPLPTPNFPPNPHANREWSTRCTGYRGPPVGSKDYDNLLLLFKQISTTSASTGVKSRLGQRQPNSVKSCLGPKPVHSRLTPKATTLQGQPPRTASPPPAPAPAPVPAPSPSLTAPAPDWTGDPSPSGNISSNRVRVKRFIRPSQKIRRSKSNTTILVSGLTTRKRFTTSGENFNLKYSMKDAYEDLTNPQYSAPDYDPSSPTHSEDDNDTDENNDNTEKDSIDDQQTHNTTPPPSNNDNTDEDP